MIGEGANLAITQRGRTEYGLHGGRHNTDAIDNSAGVDCSDHEVNLKILLVAADGVRRSSTREARDKLLRELEPDVGRRVRAGQLPAVRAALDGGRCAARSTARSFLDVLSYLDKHGLSRVAEHIPPDEELRGWLVDRQGPAAQPARGARRAHEERPLRARADVADPGPAAVPAVSCRRTSRRRPAAKFPEQVAKHHLRREIIATVVTNAIINQAGCTLLVQLGKETSAPMDELVVRYFMIDELLGGRKLRAAIHAARLQDRGGGPVRRAARVRGGPPLPAALVELERGDVASSRPRTSAKTKPQFDGGRGGAGRPRSTGWRALAYEAREQDLVQRGFSPEVATTLARGAAAPRGVRAARRRARRQGRRSTGRRAAFHRVGRELHVDAFDEILATQIPANSWERRFFASLEREAAAVRQRRSAKLAGEPELVERNRERIDRIGDALGMVKQLGAHGLVPLFLILEDYRALT